MTPWVALSQRRESASSGSWISLRHVQAWIMAIPRTHLTHPENLPMRASWRGGEAQICGPTRRGESPRVSRLLGHVELSELPLCRLPSLAAPALLAISHLHCEGMEKTCGAACSTQAATRPWSTCTRGTQGDGTRRDPRAPPSTTGITEWIEPRCTTPRPRASTAKLHSRIKVGAPKMMNPFRKTAAMKRPRAL